MTDLLHRALTCDNGLNTAVQRWNSGRPLTRSSGTSRRQAPMKATCSVDGCERDGRMSRGMCHTCYERLRRSGAIEPLHIPTPAERLTAGCIRKSNGCLEWTGTGNGTGYGQIYFNGKTVTTHRLAWTLAYGPIPDGMFVCHRCDVRLCCERTHLFLGTHLENIADMVAKGRASNAFAGVTYCKNGHEFTKDNTYTRLTGGRTCKTCSRASVIRYRTKSNQ